MPYQFRRGQVDRRYLPGLARHDPGFRFPNMSRRVQSPLPCRLQNRKSRAGVKNRRNLHLRGERYIASHRPHRRRGELVRRHHADAMQYAFHFAVMVRQEAIKSRMTQREGSACSRAFTVRQALMTRSGIFPNAPPAKQQTLDCLESRYTAH